MSPNVTVRHLSIFFKARKCPSFHTVLGSLRIDPKKVINLLMLLNDDVLVFARKGKIKKYMKFTTSLELILCNLIGSRKIFEKGDPN